MRNAPPGGQSKFSDTFEVSVRIRLLTALSIVRGRIFAVERSTPMKTHEKNDIVDGNGETTFISANNKPIQDEMCCQYRRKFFEKIFENTVRIRPLAELIIVEGILWLPDS